MTYISEYRHQPARQLTFGGKGKVDKETQARRRAWEEELRQRESEKQAETKPQADSFEYGGPGSALNPTIPPAASPTPAKKSPPAPRPHTSKATDTSPPEANASTLALANLLAKKDAQKEEKRLEKQRQQAQTEHANLQKQLKSSLELLAEIGLLGEYLKDPADKILLQRATRYKSLPSDAETAKAQEPDLFTPAIQQQLTRFHVTRAKDVVLGNPD